MPKRPDWLPADFGRPYPESLTVGLPEETDHETTS